MSEPTVVEAPAPAPVAKATPKKKSSKTKAASAKQSHPKVSLMVNTAITELKERGGSSLQAIKKYISSTYKVDAEKLAPFIRKHLKTAVASGSLIQTKGKGASGSFKVGGSKIGSAPKAPKKAVSKPVKAKAQKVRKASEKKVKPAKIAKPKKVSKVKAKKSPAKAPKPKKTMKAKAGKAKVPKQKK